MAKKEKEKLPIGKRIFKIVRRILILLIFLIFVGIIYGEHQLVKYAIGPDTKSKTRDIEPSTKAVNVSMTTDVENSTGNAWSNTNKYDEVSVKGGDDSTLSGHFYSSFSKNKKYVILCHPYKEDMSYMYSYAKHYASQGYGVLLIDLRAHGESDGKYVGMGYLDKDDLQAWVNMLYYKEPDAQIVIHGVGMGAATALMAANDGFKVSNVKCIIADSSYTDAMSIMKLEMEKRFDKIPLHPTIDVASYVAKFEAGYTLEEASPLKNMDSCRVPVLFIHGLEDSFVPAAMTEELYDKATCDKELFEVEGAEHLKAKDINPEAYFDKIYNFADKYILQVTMDK